MLHFRFGATATVFLTLMESATLSSPSFLFEFTPRVANEAQAFTVVLAPALVTDRSEKFVLDIDTLFSDKQEGQWTYKVYEQEDPDNTDVANAGKLLETGIVELHASTSFTYTQYEPETNITQYND